MNKVILLLVLGFAFPFILKGQGIRKHYTELTNQERTDYRNALNNLISSGGIEQFAGYHADPDQDGNDGGAAIHGNEDFLPWHRQFLIEFEDRLQEQNSNLTIPYWDWTGSSDPSGVTSRGTNGPLWTNDQINTLDWSGNFLGSYNSQLNLGRQLGGSTLPTAAQVAAVKAITAFSSFRVDLESIHNVPHGWVGGIMNNIRYSPRDPVFYFHHAMVDKVWQDWVEMGNTTSFSNNTMPTFDGTVAGFAAVGPRAIVDSRTLGIFYSDPGSQTATLTSYSVTNNRRPVEKFVYQYDIIAENDFTIPNGRSAEIRSIQSITLKPGFIAAFGSNVVIKVDNDNNFNTNSRMANNGNKEGDDIFANVDNEMSESGNTIKVYPNPSRGKFVVETGFMYEDKLLIRIRDAQGRVILNIESQQGRNEIDISQQPKGLYLVDIIKEGEIKVMKVVKY